MRFAILGGTGTLGTELTRRLLMDGHEVWCLSRDELKQKELGAKFKRDGLHFRICDMRNRDSLARAIPRDTYTLFHVAALKHVDTLQLNPEESVYSNILGTMNVCDVAESMRVQRVIFSSTDKAEAPINVYGMSKAISERILLNRNGLSNNRGTEYGVYRWGNVLASRGSAIQGFVAAVASGRPVDVTNTAMTRFWIRIEDAVDYMLKTYSRASTDSVMLPPIKAAPVMKVIEAIGMELKRSPEIRVVGIRPGEKLHESLAPDLHSDDGPQFTMEELRELIRPFTDAVSS